MIDATAAHPARWFLRALHVVCIVMLACSMAAPAIAQDGTDPADELRAKLAAATKPGDWKGYLKKLEEFPEPERAAVYERVLGPLLLETEPAFAKRPSEERRDLKAFLAQALLEDSPPAVIEDVEDPADPEAPRKDLRVCLVHVMANPEVRKLVRVALTVDPDTQRAAGWDRMLRIAGGVLTTVANRGSDSLAVLMAEAGGTREIDVLALLVKYRGEGAAKLGQPTPSEYRGAFARILGHEFKTVALADDWIKTYIAELLGTWETWASWDKDGMRARVEADVRRIVKEFHIKAPVMHKDEIDDLVAEVLNAIKKIEKDEAARLAVYWETDPGNPKPWHEKLQRAAIQRAKELKLGSDAQGVAALSGLFLNVVYRDVLMLAMDLVNGWAIQEPTEETRKIAKEMRKRLMGLAGTYPQDQPEDRLRLVRFLSVLGGVGHLGPVLSKAGEQATEAVERQAPGAEEAVAFYVETINALARINGATVERLTQEYRRNGGLAIVEARVAVVEGLSRRRIRENEEERPKAAAFLGRVLGKDADGAVEPDPTPKVRQAAIKSLGDFPGDETVAVLAPLARGAKADDKNSRKLAQMATAALVRHLMVHSSAGAGDALAATLPAYAQDPEMQRYVLTTLADSGDAAKAPKLAQAIRAILEGKPPCPAETREVALRCVILLAEPAAIDVILTLLGEAHTARAALPAASENKDEQAKIDAADAEVARLEKALASVAMAIYERSDNKDTAKPIVAGLMRKMTDAGAPSWVMSLLESLGDNARDPLFRLEEAFARAARAQLESPDPAARLADAEAAIELFGELVDGLGDEDKKRVYRERFQMHLLRAKSLVTEPVAKAEAFKKAFQIAVGQKTDAKLVQDALREWPLIEALEGLPEELRTSLQKLKAQLEAAAAAGGG